MKLRILTALLLCFVSTSVLATQQLISVPVRFETLLSSEMFTAKHQDNFDTPKAVVAQDIFDIEGNITIKEGTEVIVYVDTKQRKNMARRGKITFTLKEVKDVYGNLIPLNTTFDVVGRKKEGFIGQAFSGELAKKSARFSIAGTRATTTIGVAVGTAATVGIGSALFAGVNKVGLDKADTALRVALENLFRTETIENLAARFGIPNNYTTYQTQQALHNTFGNLEDTVTLEEFLSDIVKSGLSAEASGEIPAAADGVGVPDFLNYTNMINKRNEAINNTTGILPFVLKHEVALQRTLKVAKVVAIGATVAAVAAGIVTTIVLASTKGREAIIEPGAIWLVVTTAPSL